MEVRELSLREVIEAEVHARPFPVITSPNVVIYASFLKSKRSTEQLDQLLNDMCRIIKCDVPEPIKKHNILIGPDEILCWEDHTEFVSALCFGSTPQDKISGAIKDILEIAKISDAVLKVVSIELCISNGASARKPSHQFDANNLVHMAVYGGKSEILTDLTEDETGVGYLRINCGKELSPGQIGRLIQRLVEIEAYRSLALFGFVETRDFAGRIIEAEAQMDHIMHKMKAPTESIDDLLEGILNLSMDVEQLINETTFRLRATDAYAGIVEQRLSTLTGDAIGQEQTLSEALNRRVAPAIRTGRSIEQRLQGLADRVERAANLLTTRVEVRRTAQTQELLTSMERRSELQLRLQEAVEGLSIVAISYYGVRLTSGFLEPLATSIGYSKAMLTAAITLPVVGLVYLSVRKLKKRWTATRGRTNPSTKS